MSEQVISEAASEKPKRGRPRVFDLEIWKAIFPDIRSDRALTNIVYRARAVKLITDSEHKQKLRWLYDKDNEIHWKPEVLTELGRVSWEFGDHAFFNFALAICAGFSNLKSKEICARLRRSRMQLRKDGLR